MTASRSQSQHDSLEGSSPAEIVSVSTQKPLSLIPIVSLQKLEQHTDFDFKEVKVKEQTFNKNHPDVVKEIQHLIELCSLSFSKTDLSDTNFQMPIRYYIELSLQHFIRECIEVISWLQKNDESFTYLYSKDPLADSIKYAAENITKFATSYYPQRTIYFNPEKQLIAKGNKKRSMGKALGINDVNDYVEDKVLQLASKSVNVFLPICYGFGIKHNDISFHKVVDSLKQFLNVSTNNITIYLGPHEEIGPSPEQNRENEKEFLKNWLRYQERYLDDNNIKVIIHKHENVEIEYQQKSTEWEKSAEYKAAEEIFYQMLVHEDHKTLGYKLQADVFGYVNPKFNKAILEAKEEKKAKVVLAVESINATLPSIRRHLTYNTFMMYCLMVKLSPQRDEHRLYTPITFTQTLLTDTRIAEKSELSSLIYDTDNKEPEEEKIQLLVSAVEPDPIPAYPAAIYHLASLIRQFTQELRSTKELEQWFYLISGYIGQTFTFIENVNDITNGNRLELINTIVGTVIDLKAHDKLNNSFINCMLKKLIEIVNNYKLLKNPKNFVFKENLISYILEVKALVCPLESEVESFLAIFEKIQSQKYCNPLDKQNFLASHVRQTLGLFKNMIKAKSLFESTKIYILLIITVIASPALNETMSSLFGLFKSSIKRDLMSEILSSVLTNRHVGFCKEWSTLSKSIDEQVLVNTLQNLHTEYKNSLLRNNSINTALREEWIIRLTEQLHPFEKASWGFKTNNISSDRAPSIMLSNSNF